MLGQLLITLLVIVLATLYLRKRARHENESSSRQPAPPPARDSNPWREGQAARMSKQPPVADNSTMPDYRILLSALLALALALATTLYYFSWQDARSPVTVILHRDDNSTPVIYEVRKRDLGERSFTTIDGTRVRVSANERMEIIGL